MILNDTYRFAFVHIPKCAGTSVRDALARYDESADRFHAKSVAPHPVLGPLDHHHIPLAVLQEHFPEEFARLTAYRSFALVRDPFSRFPSSLHQRLAHRGEGPLAEKDGSEVAREVDSVIARLGRHGPDDPVTDPDLIHFSRQSDYVFLDGRQVVQTLRTVAETGDLLAEIFDLLGAEPPPFEKSNQRVRYASPVLQHVHTGITVPIQNTFPRWLWKPVFTPIKRAFLKTGVLREQADPLETLPDAEDIRAFIEEFYADDIALFERLEAARRN